MNKSVKNYFLGIDVIIQWEHEVGDQKRKHKKKRINKKWLKRYGVWEEWEGACPKSQAAIFIDNKLYVSRKMYKILKETVPKFDKVAHHGNSYTR